MTTRERAKVKYLDFVRQGVYMTSYEFALRTPDFLGEQVPLSTVKSWMKEDQWREAFEIGSFEASEELRRQGILLEIAYADILTAEEDHDRATTATTYRSVVRRLPKNLVPLIEDDIVKTRELLFRWIKNGPEMAKTHKRTMIREWGTLGDFLMSELPLLEEDGVEADSFILAARGGGT